MPISFLAGLVSSLPFVNPALFWINYFSLFPFLREINHAPNLKSALANTFWFALPFFMVVLWWLNELNAFVPFWSTLAYFGLVGLEVLLFLGFGGVMFYLKEKSTNLFWLMCPAVFVIFEGLRTIGMFGITAGGLAYGQAAFLPYLQIAKYLGGVGVTFWVVLINCLWGKMMDDKKSRFWLAGALVFLLVGNFALGTYLIYGYDQSQLKKDLPSQSSRLKIALIQGNIPQAERLRNWNNTDYFKKYRAQSLAVAKEQPDLYVWPETALNNYIEGGPVLGDLANLAQTLSASLIVGAPRSEHLKSYNSAFCFNRAGVLAGIYDKKVLVPFGEYLPLRNFIYPFLASTRMYDTDYYPGNRPGIVKINGKPVGLLICFESTFAAPARERVSDGANFLLTLTNDAWFGQSFGLHQHLSAGILRAVENGSYFVQVANTGFTAVVDGVGRVTEVSEIDRAQSLVAEVPGICQPTFYTRFGEVFGMICLVGSLGVVLGTSRQKFFR